MASIQGACDPRFEGVRARFASHFARGLEVGAALHVVVDGRPVIDLWAGHADAAGQRAWGPDTLVSVASTTKGFVAAAMHMLADRGLLDLDAPVARYWPEFASNGKDRVLVRHVLSHSAGLPAPTVRLPDAAVYDWGAVTDAIAASDLWWEPGTKFGYHAATFGWINGELIRRIDGRSPGTFIRDEISVPLGADFLVGVPVAEQGRCADIIPPAGATADTVGGAWDPGSIAWMTFNNPPRRPSEMSSPRWRSAEIPSSNGHGTARGVARFYEALAGGGAVDGVRLLSAPALDRAVAEECHGVDEVLRVETRRSLGFMLPVPALGDPRGPRAFGHAGAGGSVGFADPEHGLAFGYVMNQMGPPVDVRWRSLAAAVYEALA